MPALDEGTTLDMPVTVPRASVTQAADDLKHRDALLRGFPEVESVIGKAGRADTPTDPAPLDMVETFVNFRPKELWPKRVLRFNDAVRQTRDVLRALEERGYVVPRPHEDDRDGLDQRRDPEGAGALRRDHARTGPAPLPGVRTRTRPGPDPVRHHGHHPPLPSGRQSRLARRGQRGGRRRGADAEVHAGLRPLARQESVLEDASKLTLEIPAVLHDRNALRMEFRLTDRSIVRP